MGPRHKRAGEFKGDRITDRIWESGTLGSVHVSRKFTKRLQVTDKQIHPQEKLTPNPNLQYIFMRCTYISQIHANQLLQYYSSLYSKSLISRSRTTTPAPKLSFLSGRRPRSGEVFTNVSDSWSLVVQLAELGKPNSLKVLGDREDGERVTGWNNVDIQREIFFAICRPWTAVNIRTRQIRYKRERGEIETRIEGEGGYLTRRNEESLRYRQLRPRHSY